MSDLVFYHLLNIGKFQIKIKKIREINTKLLPVKIYF